MEDDSVRVGFAFIKATEGLMLVDSYFKRNWREAPKAGITCGAYHFFRPKKAGLWQARFFLQNLLFIPASAFIKITSTAILMVTRCG
jgi:lysozyme